MSCASFPGSRLEKLSAIFALSSQQFSRYNRFISLSSVLAFCRSGGPADLSSRDRCLALHSSVFVHPGLNRGGRGEQRVAHEATVTAVSLRELISREAGVEADLSVEMTTGTDF